MPDAPITLKQRTLLCENTVFSVYSDHVRDEAGGEVRDYLAIVPRNRTAEKMSGVAILPVLEGRYGLICIYRHPLGEFCWEVPRGFIDAAESPVAAALRELKEETGLVPGEPLVPLGMIAPEPGVLDAKVGLFAAPHCTRSGSAGGGEMGHRELKFFTRDELVALIDEGRILDPCTLVATLKYLGRPS